MRFESEFLRRLMEEWMKRRMRKPPMTEPEDTYYEAHLTQAERRFLLERAKDYTADAAKGVRKRSIEALELARQIPLPRSEWLDFDELEAEAARQGVDVTEIWFDRIRKREANA